MLCGGFPGALLQFGGATGMWGAVLKPFSCSMWENELRGSLLAQLFLLTQQEIPMDSVTLLSDDEYHKNLLDP